MGRLRASLLIGERKYGFPGVVDHINQHAVGTDRGLDHIAALIFVRNFEFVPAEGDCLSAAGNSKVINRPGEFRPGGAWFA